LISGGCGVTQFRVRHDSVTSVAWVISACGVAQL
jgi:hypothetical protein